MLTDFTQNNPKYICQFCDMKTSNKKDFNKHLLTAKHKKNEKKSKIYSKLVSQSILVFCVSRSLVEARLKY